MNLFSLHGKHFRNDENRLTANLAVLLNEARRGFLPAFLSLCEIPTERRSIKNVEIVIQEPQTHDEVRSILDAKVRLPGEFVAVIESKIGFNSVNSIQALKYASWLNSAPEMKRRLIFVTQIREPIAEAEVRSALQSHGFQSVECNFLLWQQIFLLLRDSECLDPKGANRCQHRILNGVGVSSVERLSYLFLNEVEKMAYDLSIVDDLAVGDVEDVVVQVQHRWFMNVALNHNTWFPPSTSIHGLRPAKYVAYYQTADNEQPRHLSHIARIRKVWKRVSFEDARVLPEFESLFSNAELSSEVATFKNKEGLFHIALTDPPVALANPIPLGSPSTAQFLTKKRFPLTKLLAAKTTDDLLLAKSTEDDN